MCERGWMTGRNVTESWRVVKGKWDKKRKDERETDRQQSKLCLVSTFPEENGAHFCENIST